MFLAPVNPADINTIQGVYPVKPPLPATPGYEGIGEVLSVGSAVKNLVPGDRVIPNGIVGTWCTAGVFDSEKLRKVSIKLLSIKCFYFIQHLSININGELSIMTVCEQKSKHYFIIADNC